jgi:hypothetical protein
LASAYDVADVVGDAFLLFLEAFDAFDQEAQAVVGGSGHRVKSPLFPRIGCGSIAMPRRASTS